MSTPLVLLIDDRRSFLDEREALVARTCEEGIALLEAHRESHIHELWLDHDLGKRPDGELDDSRPVLDLLQRSAFKGTPFLIDTVYVQTSNPSAREVLVVGLLRFGYTVKRAPAESIFFDAFN